MNHPDKEIASFLRNIGEIVLRLVFMFGFWPTIFLLFLEGV